MVCNTSIALTGCVGCAVNASVCVLQAVSDTTTSTSSVCSCLSSLYSCLTTGTVCDVTPLNGMCAAYSAFCPSSQCSGSSSKAAVQIAAYISQYETQLVNYLQQVLQGSNITFGSIQANGFSEVVDVTVTIPDTITIDAYFTTFKSKFALYFQVSPNQITITYGTTTIKRNTQSAQITIKSSSESMIGSLLLIMCALLVLFFM